MASFFFISKMYVFHIVLPCHSYIVHLLWTRVRSVMYVSTRHRSWCPGVLRHCLAATVSCVSKIQLSHAIPNPLLPWTIVRYIQRFGIEGVPLPGKTVPSLWRTVRYIQRFGIEGVWYSERQLYVIELAMQQTRFDVASAAPSA